MTDSVRRETHSLERTVLIAARRRTVFRFFTETDLWAEWWGAGSTIDGRSGGAVVIRFPNAVVARGEVLAIEAPSRIVFTWGYEDPAKGLPVGGSTVTVELEEVSRGTLVRLVHELPTAALRDEHVQGWRYQLALFANVAASRQVDGGTTLVDRYFAAWGEEDADARRALLNEVLDTDVVFRDAFSCTADIEDLSRHLAAARVHMPGVRLERRGDVRHCQGTLLVEWAAVNADRQEVGTGTNVFELSPDGKISRVTGFWKR